MITTESGLELQDFIDCVVVSVAAASEATAGARKQSGRTGHPPLQLGWPNTPAAGVANTPVAGVA